MFKRLFYFILLICITFSITACKSKQKAIILFNQAPITNENFLSNSSKFIAGKRIYYIFITEKPLDVDMIRIRVLKRDEKGEMTPTKVVFSEDFKLQKEHQQYYYNDYLVIQDAGYYCMTIYSTMALNRPLAVGDFQVTN